MERYSVIVVADETAPVRRFDVRRDHVRRVVWAAAISAVLLVVGLIDYVRVRVEHAELGHLRAEVVEQRDQIGLFEETLGSVEAKLGRIGEFERKVRIIANLPGSAAAGGEDVAEVGSEDAGPPPGLSAETGLGAETPSDASGTVGAGEPHAAAAASDAGSLERLSALRANARALGKASEMHERSIAELADQLESKREHLASTPAIWPTKGWLTSRFGSRVSPFTNKKQFHAGLDIAGERGTDIVAPAKGRIVFSGTRGPLGKSVIIDHGYKVRTLYGHNDELYVKKGDKVERGQRIASLGSSGRSTGPHLHYVVEVKGKAVNPIDYIFD